MVPDFFAVEDYRRLEVDGSEVQQHLPSNPALGNLEAAAIPEPVILGDLLHHAREGGLYREGDKDLVGEGGGFGVPGGDGEVPQAVEVEPFLADQLRARVFRVDMLGRDVLGPARAQRTLGRLPRSPSLR